MCEVVKTKYLAWIIHSKDLEKFRLFIAGINVWLCVSQAKLKVLGKSVGG